MDIKITWLSPQQESSNLFEETSTMVEKNVQKSKNLNLDVVFIYKNTTLRTVAEYILSKIKVDNQHLMWTINFLVCLLYYTVSPKSTSVHFFDDNEFREIFSLFKTSRGEQFIEKSDVNTIPNITEIMDILIRKKVIKETNERYYVVGHILKELEINSINNMGLN